MNKFGLDDYTYDLLINFFKSKPEIKIVRIFGSRVMGKSRKASDLDMLVEGTYDAQTLTSYVDEINALRHPYRIDLIDMNTENLLDETFVCRNHSTSEYFYNSKDYYPTDDYTEKGCPTKEGYVYHGEFYTDPTKNDKKRWQYRYKGIFCNRYDNLKEKWTKFLSAGEINNQDINFQIKIFESFKGVFEGAWKTIKDFYKEQGVKMFMPREILKKAHEDGIISDYKVWSDMIYDFNIMTDYQFFYIKDELLYRLKAKYLHAIDEFDKYFSDLYEKDVNENVTK